MDCQVRDGAPSCVTTRRTLRRWTCLLCRALASTCSIPSSSLVWAGDTSSGLTRQQIRPLTGSRANSPRLSLGTRPRTTLFAIGIASTAPSSHAVCVPWASETSPSHRLRLGRMGFERMIGPIRRECLDHFVVWGETHLRRILRTYARYYNDIRTHKSLDKDAPGLSSHSAYRNHQPTRHIDHTRSNLASAAILGGLHHHYVRI